MSDYAYQSETATGRLITLSRPKADGNLLVTVSREGGRWVQRSFEDAATAMAFVRRTESADERRKEGRR